MQPPDIYPTNKIDKSRRRELSRRKQRLGMQMKGRSLKSVILRTMEKKSKEKDR